MSAAASPLPAALSERICGLRAGGASYNLIAATLNRHGVRGTQGGRWFAASVRRVLLLQAAADPAPVHESN